VTEPIIIASGLPSVSHSDRSKARVSPAATRSEQSHRLIRNLIWIYILLWLTEGALRRWFLPGLASPLLLVRDPIVVAIYFIAAANNLFPRSAFIGCGALLAALSFANAVLLGHGNALVALFGVRCDFLHVPLIFIMARILRREDLIVMAKVACWISVPYTALLVAQFYEPQDAWVNRGVGGKMEGAGFTGALDRFRPPGTFSFISGPSQLYPLFTACWFMLLISRRLPLWLMVASGAAILVAIPISISRILFLSVAIVAAAGVGALLVGGRFSMRLVAQFAFAAVALALIASQSTIFQDGMAAFSARWQTATTDAGGFQEAIVDRALNDLFGSFGGVTLTGLGTGFSTNVGQKALTTEVGFGASESEWGRLLYDNGLLVGGLMVCYRAALAGTVVYAALKAWRRRSPFGLLFAAACFMMVLNGPWGQTTTLGSAIIGAGLALAASAKTKKRNPVPAKQTVLPIEASAHATAG
jgi:hypothetical protein